MHRGQYESLLDLCAERREIDYLTGVSGQVTGVGSRGPGTEVAPTLEPWRPSPPLVLVRLPRRVTEWGYRTTGDSYGEVNS